MSNANAVPSAIIKSPPIQLDPWTRDRQRAMTLSEFTYYVETEIEPSVAALYPTQQRNVRTVSQIFLHHTWRPTPATWNGYATILAMKSYYERQPWVDEQGHQHEGWTAGPHVFVAPDGIWLFTPLLQDGVGVAGHNAGTRHVEMVGDYDQAPPSGDILYWTVAVLALLHRAFRLRIETLGFHRDFSDKTCPGSAVSKTDMIADARAWLKNYETQSALRLIEHLRTVACAATNVPYTPGHALRTHAKAWSLGAALADEFEITRAGVTYAVQPFALGIVYCPKGRWTECTHATW
jgi:hypothetical protein